MLCHKSGKELMSNELFCRRCIVQFLEKYHGVSMKLRTRREKRRLREYGLRRRNEVLSKREVREIIKRETEGPSSLPFLKTEQLYHNGILFQSSVQWQISHLTNCATNFSVRVSLKFHIDGRKYIYIYTCYPFDHCPSTIIERALRVI